ncbi:MAG: methenyltetrahydromethanopterin cyclohydrolase [Caldiserica bacterium]|jgi:methenyltetrahydromethanopterin cyclohydrolase|nr:methenyltetrahydromethanopterin cyclohydrolase [Caldisericota bacterium]MDH7562017.1 methenyltetrahydromethanopterin cyclohydrolase [Caldisericota bacterium]
MNPDFSLNDRAFQIVQRMIKDAPALGIKVGELTNGVKVLDATASGYQAGKLFAEVCLGGLGEVSFTSLDFPEFSLPGVSVTVEHPFRACLASQYAGWSIKVGNFFALGSGPARALARVEKLFEELEYSEEGENGVLALECRTAPPDEVGAYIAKQCRVKPQNLFILFAPTASLVGSIQISARIVETGMHKMRELGYDIKKVKAGFGTCPLAPVAKDDLQAIGWTNDCVLYGGKAYYLVEDRENRIEEVISKIPSSASKDYGVPFLELFKRYGNFYDIDPMLFSPAEVYVNNLSNGKTLHSGGVNLEILKRLMS